MSEATHSRQAVVYTDGKWHRLHLLTPVLRAGLAVAAIAGFFLASFWDAMITAISSFLVYREVPEIDPGYQPLPELPLLGSVLIGLALAGFVVLLGGLWLWVSWYLHTVRITDDSIEVRDGVIFRTHRQVRRDRINSVAIWRPLVPRLLGLSKLEFQAAGSDANVTLAYLADPVARQLRRLVLSDEADTAEATSPSAKSVTPGELVLHVVVPMGRLLGSLLVSLETAWFVTVLLAIVIGANVTGDPEWWIGAFPAVLVYLATLIRGWVRASRFRLESVAGNIRVSYGLLSTAAASIPPARVHALHISQPWPWRIFGWWRAEIHRAITPGQEGSTPGPAHTLVLPVGTIDDVLEVSRLFLGIPLGDSVAAIPQGIRGPLTELEGARALRPAPISRFRLLLSYPVQSIALIAGTLWLRTGLLVRKLTIVPLERIQSSGTFRGPWHLLTGLTGLECHLVPGPGLTRLIGFSSEEARLFAGEMAKRVVSAVAHYRKKKQ